MSGSYLGQAFEPGATLKVEGGASANTPSYQGHLLWASKGAASQNTTHVNLGFERTAVWSWGCDFGKVN